MEDELILITGGTGKLGKQIISQLNGRNILFPTRFELNITDPDSVKKYFDTHKINAVIHCAAIASVGACEKNPALALTTNSLGTANLVSNCLGKNIRFIYISTDYVYPCKDGNYKETDFVEPFTVYGLTKLAGENMVKILPNSCIIRTSFFNPNDIPFNTAFIDSFSSKIALDQIAKEVIYLLDKNFKGIINIGRERISFYDLYKNYKPEIKPESLLDSDSPVKRAKDSSMDISLLNKIKGIKNGN